MPQDEKKSKVEAKTETSSSGPEAQLLAYKADDERAFTAQIALLPRVFEQLKKIKRGEKIKEDEERALDPQPSESSTLKEMGRVLTNMKAAILASGRGAVLKRDVDAIQAAVQVLKRLSQGAHSNAGLKQAYADQILTLRVMERVMGYIEAYTGGGSLDWTVNDTTFSAAEAQIRIRDAVESRRHFIGKGDFLQQAIEDAKKQQVVGASLAGIQQRLEHKKSIVPTTEDYNRAQAKLTELRKALLGVLSNTTSDQTQEAINLNLDKVTALQVMLGKRQHPDQYQTPQLSILKKLKKLIRNDPRSLLVAELKKIGKSAAAIQESGGSPAPTIEALKALRQSLNKLPGLVTEYQKTGEIDMALYGNSVLRKTATQALVAAYKVISHSPNTDNVDVQRASDAVKTVFVKWQQENTYPWLKVQGVKPAVPMTSPSTWQSPSSSTALLESALGRSRASSLSSVSSVSSVSSSSFLGGLSERSRADSSLSIAPSEASWRSAGGVSDDSESSEVKASLEGFDDSRHELAKAYESYRGAQGREKPRLHYKKHWRYDQVDVDRLNQDLQEAVARGGQEERGHFASDVSDSVRALASLLDQLSDFRGVAHDELLMDPKGRVPHFDKLHREVRALEWVLNKMASSKALMAEPGVQEGIQGLRDKIAYLRFRMYKRCVHQQLDPQGQMRYTRNMLEDHRHANRYKQAEGYLYQAGVWVDGYQKGYQEGFEVPVDAGSKMSSEAALRQKASKFVPGYQGSNAELAEVIQLVQGDLDKLKNIRSALRHPDPNAWQVNMGNVRHGTYSKQIQETLKSVEAEIVSLEGRLKQLKSVQELRHKGIGAVYHELMACRPAFYKNEHLGAQDDKTSRVALSDTRLDASVMLARPSDRNRSVRVWDLGWWAPSQIQEVRHANNPGDKSFADISIVKLSKFASSKIFDCSDAHRKMGLDAILMQKKNRALNILEYQKLLNSTNTGTPAAIEGLVKEALDSPIYLTANGATTKEKAAIKKQYAVFIILKQQYPELLGKTKMHFQGMNRPDLSDADLEKARKWLNSKSVKAEMSEKGHPLAELIQLVNKVKDMQAEQQYGGERLPATEVKEEAKEEAKAHPPRPRRNSTP